MTARVRVMGRGIGPGILLLLTLASVGCAGLWARTHYRSDSVSYVAADGSWRVFLETNVNQLALAVTRQHVDSGDAWLQPGWRREWDEKPNPAGDWRQQLAHYPSVRASWGFASFDWFAADGRAYGDFPFPAIREVGVPLWLATLLTGAAPALAVLAAVRRRRARRRRRAGACEGCGYDLRASPERCPECGTPVPPPH